VSALFTFTCPACKFSVEVWDDGHPYILDPKGKKHFFYHPADAICILPIARLHAFAQGKTDPELMNLLGPIIGHQSDAICLDCSKEFQSEDADAAPFCSRCKSANTVWTLELGGSICPKCKTASFPPKGVFSAIS